MVSLNSQSLIPFLCNPLLNLFRECLHVSRKDASGGAGQSARRRFIVLYLLVAEVALHRHLRVFIKLHSPERTGLDAFLAPDTDIIVNENNARLISQPP